MLLCSLPKLSCAGGYGLNGLAPSESPLLAKLLSWAPSVRIGVVGTEAFCAEVGALGLFFLYLLMLLAIPSFFGADAGANLGEAGPLAVTGAVGGGAFSGCSDDCARLTLTYLERGRGAACALLNISVIFV